MGTGIMAAVPLIFKPYEGEKLNKKKFATGFVDNYIVEAVDGNERYVIKSDVLIKNYKSFLLEFYDLIGEDFEKETEITPDEIPTVGSFDEFIETFGYGNRSTCVPFIYNKPYAFSVLGCKCDLYWVFYGGSYKAILEEYRSLLHFERILAKSMKNPLSNAVKFGLFG